jgi:3-oxoacyl-[acyl-carrier-protein] synthase-3
MARIAQIISTARYLPEHLVTNAELTTRFTALGRPHVIDKLANRTGIGKRFYVPDDWVTSDLAQAELPIEWLRLNLRLASQICDSCWW